MVSGVNLSLRKGKERCFAQVFQCLSSFLIPKSVIKCLWQLILPLDFAHNNSLTLHSHSLPFHKPALDIFPHSTCAQRLRSHTTLFLTDPQVFPSPAPKLHQHPKITNPPQIHDVSSAFNVKHYPSIPVSLVRKPFLHVEPLHLEFSLRLFFKWVKVAFLSLSCFTPVLPY